METLKKILSGGILLVSLLVVFVWVGSTYVANGRIGASYYSYERAGLSFSYPSHFEVKKIDIDSENTRITFYKKSSDAVKSIAQEMEPTISCAVTNNPNNISFTEWIAAPTYKSSVGQIMEHTIYPSADIPSIDALGFKTDGLYVSDHVLFNAREYMVDCSVEYITPDDALRADFVGIMSSIVVASE